MTVNLGLTLSIVCIYSGFTPWVHTGAEAAKVTSGSLAPTLTMSSQDCTQPSSCRDVKFGTIPKITCTVQGSGGHLLWTDEDNYRPGCKKVVLFEVKAADPDDGIVLEDIQLKGDREDNYVVHNDDHDATSSRYGVHALIHPSGVMKISVNVDTVTSNPTLSFNYSVQRASTLPRTVPWRWPETQVALVSMFLYNCSHPSVVPDSLMCDKIQQCLGGEDEPEDCGYRSNGCDQGWTPFHGYCLNFVFEKNITAEDNKTSPRELCRLKFDASLLTILHRSEALEIRHLIQRSGHGFPIQGDGHTMPALPLGQTKARPSMKLLSHLYRLTWQRGGRGRPILYQDPASQRYHGIRDCMVFWPLEMNWYNWDCTILRFQKNFQAYVCEKLDIQGMLRSTATSGRLELQRPKRIATGLQTRECPDGSLVHIFHPCPFQLGEDQAIISSSSSPKVATPLFPCEVGPGVHYTFVCDGVNNCADGSDETRCSNINMTSLPQSSFVCDDSHVVPAAARCNGINDCFDNSDEESCAFCVDTKRRNMTWCSFIACMPQEYIPIFTALTLTIQCDADFNYSLLASSSLSVFKNGEYLPPPAVVELDGFGLSTLQPLKEGERCPETHFQCPGGYCIPTYLIYNGEQDCFFGEDEAIPIENLTCPGFYRCYRSGTCVHSDYLCDTVYHCPYKDDERYCDLRCPENCTCEGHAYTCRQMFDPYLFVQVRYLDLSGSDVTQLTDIHVLQFLHLLNLSDCGLTNLSLKGMPLLKTLDISFNRFHGFSSINLEELPGLVDLNVSGNPIGPYLDSSFYLFSSLAGMAALRTLEMRSTGLHSIEDGVFLFIKQLRTLDVTGNRIRYVMKDAFKGLLNLQVLHADEPRLCCDYFHEDTKLADCYTPEDALSSCSELLRSDFFRVFLWSLAVMAISGNAGVLVYRLWLEKQGTSPAFRVLIVNLTASDLLMGLYLTMIGAADAQFTGHYVERETVWKESVACKTVGFLAFLSCEVSALSIAMITLDRIIVLNFPFSHVRLTKHSAIVVSAVTWVTGLVLASLPLFFPEWEFYAQTSLCLPLPTTWGRFEGQNYSFGVLVILNFVLFLLVGTGQMCLYVSIRRSAVQPTNQDNHQREVSIASRLFLVVLTDFCCWFPLGLMGLLASSGKTIPNEISVWAAIFVLPLNSAANPFLYTLSTMLERRWKTKMKKQVDRLHVQLRTWPREKVQDLVKFCVRTGLVPKSLLKQWIGDAAPGPTGSTTTTPAEEKQQGSCDTTSGINPKRSPPDHVHAEEESPVTDKSVKAHVLDLSSEDAESRQRRQGSCDATSGIHHQ